MKRTFLLLAGLTAWTSLVGWATPLALNERQLESLATEFRKLVEAEKSHDYAVIYRLMPEVARQAVSLERFTEELQATEPFGYQLVDLRILSIERRDPELYGAGGMVIRSCGKFRKDSRIVDLLVETESYLLGEVWSFEGLLFVSSLDSPRKSAPSRMNRR